MALKTQLRRLGFEPYGNLAWSTTEPPEMRLDPIEDARTEALGNKLFSVYAFVIGNNIVRIGKHEAPAKVRIQHRADIITKWFNDTLPAYDRLSDREPPLWKAWFERNGRTGSVWCNAAREIAPKLGLAIDAGTPNPEILERVEMLLIAKFYPPINMETRRQNREPS
jgi:hypothetical protein